MITSDKNGAVLRLLTEVHRPHRRHPRSQITTHIKVFNVTLSSLSFHRIHEAKAPGFIEFRGARPSADGFEWPTSAPDS